MNIEIFNKGSRDFTRQIDSAVARGTYLRGRLFVDAVASGVSAGETVLDYGCGPGRISAALAERGFRVEGFDPSPSMLEEARKLPGAGERLSFQALVDDGASLPDARYAAIVCSSVIEFVPDPAALLRQFFRVAKPRALLALSFSNRRSLWGAYARRRYDEPHLAVQHNVWTFARTRDVLREAGFAIESGPVYFEASPFDKRPLLRGLSSSALVGTLGFVTGRRVDSHRIRP